MSRRGYPPAWPGALIFLLIIVPTAVLGIVGRRTRAQMAPLPFREMTLDSATGTFAFVIKKSDDMYVFPVREYQTCVSPNLSIRQDANRPGVGWIGVSYRDKAGCRGGTLVEIHIAKR